MGTIKITPAQQRKLRDSAKLEIERLEAIIKDAETIQLLDYFKAKYNICETAYKIILREHQKHKGKTGIGYLTVTMTQVPFALDFAGYDFEKTLLTDIFGAKSDKGTTVKKLRDAVTHGIDENAVKEIKNRKDELFGYMDSFLESIKRFDAAA